MCCQPANHDQARGGQFRCVTDWCGVKFRVNESMAAQALAKREAWAEAERIRRNQTEFELQCQMQNRPDPVTQAATATVRPDSYYLEDRCKTS